MAFPDGWKYRARIEIDATSAGLSGNLTNFPFPIGGDKPLPEEIYYGPFRARTDLDDLRFSSDPAGAIPLNFEKIWGYSSGTTYRFIVRIPTLYYNQKTTIYVWWGSYSATAPAVDDASFGREGVWDSNFKAVYTLKETASPWADSSTNDNDATAYGNLPARYSDGIYGYHNYLDGNVDYASLSRIVENDFSVDFWLRTTQDPPDGAGWYDGVGLVDGEVSGTAADWGISLIDDGKIAFGIGASPDVTIKSSVTVRDGAWHHVLCTRNNTSGALAIFVDGVSVGSGTGATGSRSAPSALAIGRILTGVNYYNGDIAHLRISDNIRTIDYSKAVNYSFRNYQAMVRAYDIREWDNVFPGGWTRRCQLVISHANVDADLTNFPVLVTEATLPSEIWSGNNHCDPDGKDIRFSSNSGGTTKLAYEIEQWDWVAQTCKIWVKVPTVSGSADTSIYVWYGKDRQFHPCRERSDFGANNVWTNYEAVFHLNETVSPAIDATGRGHSGVFNGTSFPAQVDGKVYKGQDFEAANSNYINVAGESSFDFTVDMTVEAWIKRESWTGAWDGIVTKGDTAWRLHRSNLTDKVCFICTGVSPDTALSTTDIAVGTWYHIVGNISNSKIELFVNGVEESSVTITGSPFDTNAYNVALGFNLENVGRYFDGLMDEVRISSLDLADAYIKATYHFINNPAGNITEQTPASVGHTFPNDWTTKVHIKTIGAYIDTDLTDYIAIVTEKQLPPSFWTYCKLFGGDIRASTSADGSGRLPVRTAYFDRDEQKCTLFVKMNVSDAGGNDLYIWCGTDEDDDLPFRDTTYGHENVYDTNYILVDNLSELLTDTELVDRTAYKHNFAPHGGLPFQTLTAKLAKYAQDFVQSRSDYFDRADDTDFNFGTGDFTFHFWIRFKGGTGTQQIYCKRVSGGGNCEIQKESSGKIRWYVADSGGTDYQESTTVLSNNTWYHIIFKRTSGTAKLIISNSHEASGSANRNTNTTNIITIGRDQPGANEYMDAILEELRISKVARSDAYCKIDYYSENDSRNLWTAVVEPTGITSGEAIGIPGSINMEVRPSSIASAEAFGSIRLNLQVRSNSIVSAEAFGSVRINLTIHTPTGITSAEVWGNPRFGYAFMPSGIVSGEAFGLIQYLHQQIRGTGIVSAEHVTPPGSINLVFWPHGIVSEEAFGSPHVKLQIHSPTGITSGELWGSPTLNLHLNLSSQGITSGELWGSPHIKLQIHAPTGIPSEEVVPTIPFVKWPQYPTPIGIVTEESWGGFTVNIFIGPHSIQSAEVWGAFLYLTPGSAHILASSIESGEVFGDLVISAGGVQVFPQGIYSIENWGLAELDLILRLSSIPSSEAFGSPGISTGNTVISVNGIASLETFGNSNVYMSSAIQSIGISSSEIFGGVNVVPGGRQIETTGISSLENFGNPGIVISGVTIALIGIVSAEEFGLVSIVPSLVSIHPNGIAGSEQFGSPVARTGNVNISMSGILSAEGFGSSTLSPGNVFTSPYSISPAEGFGAPSLSVGGVVISLNGIGTDELFGQPNIIQSLFPNSILPAEVFGNPSITTGNVFIVLTSIPSQEVVNDPIVRNVLVLTMTGIPSAEAIGNHRCYVRELSPFQQMMEDDLEEGFFVNEPEFAEHATYIYRDGTSFDIMVIFDNDYMEVDPDTGASAQSRHPMVTCQTSKFKRRPRNGDKMLIRGVNYEVITHQPDGTGVSELTLHHEKTV